MNTRKAYNEWAEIYDTNQNKTRDLEAIALKETLQSLIFDTCLEIGCGTGNNTLWLASRAKQVNAVDFSEEMLAKARKKNFSDKVIFHQADITLPWDFDPNQFDLVSFSLVLEHIENLDFIFSQAARVNVKGGYCYIGELHPFRQYLGTKARFETQNGTQVLTCYIHNVSDFVLAAKNHEFEIAGLNEFTHPGDKNSVPRILALLFKKTT